MSAVQKMALMAEDEYLKAEINSTIKHELVDGHVYAMAGASANHERLSGNIYRKFGNHLDDKSCEPFGSDMKLKVGSSFFYPDVMVDCDFDESEPYFTDSPVIVVEVLSKSTRKQDETTKLISYLNIPSLQEYVLIEQDFVDVEVFRRKDNWLPKHYFLDDEVSFESIGLTLSVEDIYYRVNNDEVRGFLESKNQ